MLRSQKYGASAFAFFALLMLAGPATSASVVSPPASPVQLVAAGQFDAALRLVRKLAGKSPSAGLDYAYIEGLIRLRQGKADEAVGIFRAILAAAPDFEPARLALARALVSEGEIDAAVFQFERLSQASADPGMRRIAAQELATARAERPYGFSGYVSIRPSSNVNHGTFNSQFAAGGLIFNIDRDSQAQSGLGLAAGGSAFRRWRLDEATSLQLTGTLGLDKYLQSSDFDQAAAGVSLFIKHRLGRIILFGGPIAGYDLLAWKPYSVDYGLTAGATYLSEPHTSVTFAATARKMDYDASVGYRDGTRVDAALTLQHAFSPSFTATLTFGGTLERTQIAHLDHNDLSATLELDKEWQGGLITSLSGTVAAHQYLGPFPTMTQARGERLVSIGVSVASRRFTIGGMMPKLSYTYTRQVSNVAFYDYASHDVDLTLTKDF